MDAMAVAVQAVLWMAVIALFVWAFARKRPKPPSGPVLEAEGTVVGKRTAVGGGGNIGVSQGYYVTFELADGQRLELGASGQQYGLIVEYDQGRLVYQGGLLRRFDRLPMLPSGPQDAPRLDG